MLAVLELIRSKIKSLINYILNHKLLFLSIGIIGLGIGLILAETLYEPSEPKDLSKSELERVETVSSKKNEKVEAEAPPKPVLRKLAEILYNSSRITNIKAIFWLGIAIACVGIVGLVVLKPWMFRQSRIFRLSIGIIGLGVGLVLAEVLYVPSEPKDLSKSELERVETTSSKKNKKIEEKAPPKPVLLELAETLYSSSRITDIKAIFWLGLVLIGIGVMILGFAGGARNMIGILGVVIALVGITKDPSAQSLTGVIRFTLPGFLKIEPAIRNLEEHISKTNDHLQDIKDSLTTDDQTIKVLQAENVRISQDLASQKETVKIIKGELDNAKQSQDSVTQELDNAKQELDNAKQAQDSIKQELDNAKQAQDSIKQELDNAKQAQDSVTQELGNAKQELREFKQTQNSVRLLVGTEQNLINANFLITKTRFIFKKSYRLSRELSAKDTLVTIGKPFPLESASQELVGGSGPLELVALVSHSGKLKEYAYTIVEGDSTYITFKSFLGGMDILAVVKKN